jgi:asparagine synthase (glutamine-hydrolysing)
MCGIWAIIEKSSNSKGKSMLYLNDFWKIKHRGPDNSHIETFDNVICGFHRLAVMDTSFKSNQPYVLRDQTRTIVFVCNGEVYNYQQINKDYDFDVGTSDCLVIPKLYIHFTNQDKEDSVSDWVSLFKDYIKGEFAFMLFEFDEMMKLSKYFVGRDHVGVRPLYMSLTNDDIDFYSSELKGMINYTDNCLEFPPGSIRGVTNDGFKYHSVFYNYTDLYSEHINYDKSSDEIILEKIRSVVTSSIKRRLVADRPIAFLLSGGVDSSLVAAISAKLIGQPIRTFCCGMKGSTDMKYAKLVADHIGSNHTEVYFTEEEGIQALEDVIYTTETWDTTTIRASVGQYMVSKYIGTKTDCKVVMVGEGPDEVCSSYLFNFYAPTDDDIHKTAIEYVRDIHMYDGRRADRCVSRWGLETRVPFLDPEFIRAYWSIEPSKRHPKHKDIEKYWLRKAFDGMNLLPNEVLWRKKEAFSDGVSSKERSWFQVLQEYIDENYNEEIEQDQCILKKSFVCPPQTNEAKFYRKIFLSKFGLSKDKVIPHYWQPKWDSNGIINEYVDPSARVLDVYDE